MKKFIAAIKKVVKAVKKVNAQMANYQDRESALCYYASHATWY